MENEHLAVIWSSDNPEVAHKVCFMYTHNAKRHGWFEHVTLIVWGPSAELASRDIRIQEKLRAMAEDGVVLEACKACADAYGVSEKLTELGVDVKYMGVPLTEMLKAGWHTLCF
ncbi:MAG: DsrE family protein [Anaerolineae bacterium]